MLMFERFSRYESRDCKKNKTKYAFCVAYVDVNKWDIHAWLIVENGSVIYLLSIECPFRFLLYVPNNKWMI